MKSSCNLLKEPLDENERVKWTGWLKTQYSKSEDCGIWSHHFMANGWGNNENSDRLYFLGLQNHCRWCAVMKLKEGFLTPILLKLF